MIVEYYDDVIFLSGNLRSNFWETVHTTISLQLKKHPKGVIIDCSGITEATAEGMETFRDVMKYVSEHEKARIIVAAVPENVEDVMKTVPEVRSQLAMASTVDEARRSLYLMDEQEEEGEKKRKRRDGNEPERSILCVLTQDPPSSQVLEVTKELVSTMPAKVVLMFPIMVTREMPLQAPQPEQEEHAQSALDNANEILKNNVTEARVERGRDLAAMIGEAAEELDARYTLMAIRADDEGERTNQKLVENVMKKMNRPLIFVHSPEEAGPRASSIG
jgi:hypothetical protein